MTFTEIILLLQSGTLSRKKENEISRECLQKIGDALQSEMRRRAIWAAPPRWLGEEYSHWENWYDEQALEDLSTNCYLYIFSRYSKFEPYLKKGKEIDGLIINYIKQFLTQQQKMADEIGYAVGCNVKAAVKNCIENKLLFANPAEILNTRTTVLTFSVTLNTPNDKEKLQDAIRSIKYWWALRLELVRQNQEARRKLMELISELPESYITGFRYGDLMKFIQDECRAEWNAIIKIDEETSLENSDDDKAKIVLVQPDTTSRNDWRDWCDLKTKILNAIQSLGKSDKVRNRLKILVEELFIYIEVGAEIPKQAKLARNLSHIYNHPQNLNRDITVLRQLISEL